MMTVQRCEVSRAKSERIEATIEGLAAIFTIEFLFFPSHLAGRGTLSSIFAFYFLPGAWHRFSLEDPNGAHL